MVAATGRMDGLVARCDRRAAAPDRGSACAGAAARRAAPTGTGEGGRAAARDPPTTVGAFQPRHRGPRRRPRVAPARAARCARTPARRHATEPAGQSVPARSVAARLLGVAGHRAAAGHQRVPRWRQAQRADGRGGELRSDSPGRRGSDRNHPRPLGALRPEHARRHRQHGHAARSGAARARAGNFRGKLRPAELSAEARRDGGTGRLLPGTTLHGGVRLARRLQHTDRPVVRQDRHSVRRPGRDAVVPARRQPHQAARIAAPVRGRQQPAPELHRGRLLRSSPRPRHPQRQLRDHRAPHAPGQRVRAFALVRAVQRQPHRGQHAPAKRDALDRGQAPGESPHDDLRAGQHGRRRWRVHAE